MHVHPFPSIFQGMNAYLRKSTLLSFSLWKIDLESWLGCKSFFFPLLLVVVLAHTSINFVRQGSIGFWKIDSSRIFYVYFYMRGLSSSCILDYARCHFQFSSCWIPIEAANESILKWKRMISWYYNLEKEKNSKTKNFRLSFSYLVLTSSLHSWMSRASILRTVSWLQCFSSPWKINMKFIENPSYLRT